MCLTRSLLWFFFFYFEKIVVDNEPAALWLIVSLFTLFKGIIKWCLHIKQIMSRPRCEYLLNNGWIIQHEQQLAYCLMSTLHNKRSPPWPGYKTGCLLLCCARNTTFSWTIHGDETTSPWFIYTIAYSMHNHVKSMQMVFIHGESMTFHNHRTS